MNENISCKCGANSWSFEKIENSDGTYFFSIKCLGCGFTMNFRNTLTSIDTVINLIEMHKNT